MRNSAFASVGAPCRRDSNWSRNRRSVAATSPGVGTACGLLWGVEGEVSIWESWLKKDDMDGRLPRDLVEGLMLCSTGRG